MERDERPCGTHVLDIAAKRDQTVIWQKPLTNDCYLEREPGTRPPLYRSDDDPDATWGVLIEPCITPYLTEFWGRRGENYWNLLSPKISWDTLRNVMDMKANTGSFAAALKGKDVWVMNVVPEDGPKTLKTVCYRGLLGTVHNWCDAFSTYPRTYDLLHVWTVFSDIDKKGCSGEDLLLEMDRILRPTRFIVIRDKQPVIKFVKKYLTALHWEAVVTGDSTLDPSQDGDEVVFTMQKKLWLMSESFRDTE